MMSSTPVGMVNLTGSRIFFSPQSRMNTILMKVGSADSVVGVNCLKAVRVLRLLLL
ncbi:hypothetical protein D3C77_684490 [compost metagenome]